MATSKVQIANLTLQLLGEPNRLESLTQDDPNARTISACYDRVLDAELRRHAWNFAIARESIAADGDGPTWGDWSRYSKPNDFLRLLRDDETGLSLDWKIEGDYILSADSSPLEIRYVARITDPNKYDALFITAFALAMAIHCCKEVTGSTTLRQDMKADYDRVINDAKLADSIEKAAQEFPEDDWLTARN